MTAASIEQIVSALEGKKSGSGHDCRCPAHEDRKASLSVSNGDKGIVFHCHAGCSQDEVLAALKSRGLWNGARKQERQIVATYDYRDEHGVLVSQAVRYSPKDFKQRRPDGAGAWAWNMQGVPRVPYRLREVLDAIAAGKPIYIVEGEKDVDNLRSIGLTATCNAGGAGKWQASHAQWLQGAKVVIIPDNDDPGRAHAKQVAKSLSGIVCIGCAVELPGLPQKGDVSDWLAAGGTRQELEALMLEAPRLDLPPLHIGPAMPSETWMIPPSLRKDGENGEAKGKATPSRFPRVWLDAAGADLTCDYYIKGIIGGRSVILIYGPSGEGKTFFTIDALAHVASGMEWRDRRVRQCLVVYVAAEAGASIVRRFYAWREERLSEAREGRIPLAIYTRGANLLDDPDVDALITDLRATSAEAGLPVGIVCFDTLSRSIPGGDENAPQDMTKAVGVADTLRDELGASTVFIHHSGKDGSKGARGHTSLFAAADTVIEVTSNKVMGKAVGVANVQKSRDGMTGEQFPFRLHVVDLGVDDDGDSITTCTVVPTELEPKAPPERRLTGVAAVALEALREALEQHGRTMPETSTIPKGVQAVTIEQWRDRFALRYGSDGGEKRKGDAVRQAFKRAREALLGAGTVAVSDPYAWERRPALTLMS